MQYRTLFVFGLGVFLAGPALAAGASDPKGLSVADKAFVAKVSEGGMFEVEASKIAKDKAVQQDVIDTAFTEIHDHDLVGGKLKSIAGRLGLPFPSDLNAEFKSRLDRLSVLSGKAYDEAYLQEMVVIHNADGAAFAQEARGGQNAELRDFAAETARIVRRHIGSLHAVPLSAK